MISMTEPAGLSDQALLDELDASARRERSALPHFLACLAEVERRRLHVGLGHHNLFEYCVLRLRFSEGAAMQRVCAARAAAKHPEVYARLRDGDLNLSGVARLFPYLNSANAASVLARASGKRQREIEDLIAELASVRIAAKAEEIETPEPDESDQNEFSFARTYSEPPPVAPIPESPSTAPAADVPALDINEPQAPEEPLECERPCIATQSPATVPEAPATLPTEANLCPATMMRSSGLSNRRDIIRLDAPGVLKVVFWASPDFRGKLEIIRRLVGRTDGRIQSILERVFAAYRNSRAGGPRRSRSGRRTRRITQCVKDFVWRRDDGRCSFTGPDGVRCTAIKNLEYDHIRPWALGGSSDDPANIRLLCRAHNQHAARKIFGDRVPAARAT